MRGNVQNMDDNELLDFLEDEESYKDDSTDLPPNDIVAYNELRSCADLLRMYEAKQLDIQPDFQRDIVWKTPAQTRFIDSLMKQLPIPSMCISLDYKTDKRLVIDGLQRINSIISFLSNDDWKLSLLDDIDDRISGKNVYTIKSRNPELFDRVQNMTIPITVIRCDYSKKSHNEYLFTIFHRLNTGGNKLNNQEIRNCIYNGKLNSLLKSIVDTELWKIFFGLKPNFPYRFSNEELILRFFALHDWLDTYNGKLAHFLNEYMRVNMNPNDAYLSQKKELLIATVSLIHDYIFDGQPINKLSKATLEGLLIGVARNISTLKHKQPDEIKLLYHSFRDLPFYSPENLKEGLSAREKVIERINASIAVFAN